MQHDSKRKGLFVFSLILTKLAILLLVCRLLANTGRVRLPSTREQLRPDFRWNPEALQTPRWSDVAEEQITVAE